MKITKELTPELKKAKDEIDNHYKSNPLMKLPFATAAWSFMAFAEHNILEYENRETTSQEQEIIGDNFVNELKIPLSWLLGTCKPEERITFAYDDKVFQASWDLYELGKSHQWFEVAFIYTRYEWIELELQGSTLQPTNDLFTNMEYRAYNLYLKAQESDEVLFSVKVENYPRDEIESSLRIDGDRFRYKMDPKMVTSVISVFRPIYDEAFLLPSEWQFSNYTLCEFRKVFETISAMASIHSAAREYAMYREGFGFGYSDSIFVPTCNELLRRVVRYSGVSDEKVQSIFDDLTYGNQGIKYPDPALQPLIKLTSNHYAIMPHLWRLLSPERNLTVLLNKVPKEQRIYSQLTNEKEDLMRQRIKARLSHKDLRFIYGKVPKTSNVDLGDVDLAIISHSEKACLLLELKWFIDPAEALEVINKSEEIKKGIFQMQKIKQAFEQNYKPLLQKLGIDSSYRVETIVVSQNWIGLANVQSPEVPVIRADHLIEKLKVTDTLHSTMDWLKNRKYLPTEGVHFEKHDISKTVGNWTVNWKTTRPLIQDAFFPL